MLPAALPDGSGAAGLKEWHGSAARLPSFTFGGAVQKNQNCQEQVICHRWASGRGTPRGIRIPPDIHQLSPIRQ